MGCSAETSALCGAAPGDRRRPDAAAAGLPATTGEAAAPTVDADGGFDGYRPLPDLPPRSVTIIALERAAPMADAPAWARDAVFYQVFPDRFAASDRVEKPGALEPWDAPPTHWGYKGGDLLGLAERLDELADLGITALYLNPIFSAASNHRYNAYDYRSVDPLLGGDAALASCSMRPIDGTSGSCSMASLTTWVGGSGRSITSSRTAPTRRIGTGSTWTPTSWAGAAASTPTTSPAAAPPQPRGYRSWWDVPALPKLRVEHPAVRDHLFEIAEHWLRFGIDGWRLDVPQDVEDPTFWPEFRQSSPGGEPRGVPRGRDLGRGAGVAGRRSLRRADELPARDRDPGVRRRSLARPVRSSRARRTTLDPSSPSTARRSARRSSASSASTTLP